MNILLSDAPTSSISVSKYDRLKSSGIRFRDREPIRNQKNRLREKGLFLKLDDPHHIAERAARKAGTLDSAELEEKVAALAAIPSPSQSVAMERLIGKNDLLPVAYFPSGDKINHAVGRVEIFGDENHPIGYGTAFLVAPDVVLTNNHVLPDADTAAKSRVQFNYQLDVDGQMEHIVNVRIDPNRFYTCEQLDFTLAAVNFDSSEHPPTWLPLIASDAKIVSDEAVTIIQHANAEPKQVALRSNSVVDLLPDYLHYTTDTMPGASGSPVFNDEWEVVAIHHAGVPQVDANGQIIALNGLPWDASMGDNNINWVANEGVRISRIVAFLQSQTNLPAVVQQMVASLSIQEGIMPNASSMASRGNKSASASLFDSIESVTNKKMAVFPNTSVVTSTAVAGSPLSISLPAGSSCEISIRITPTTTVEKTAGNAAEGVLADVANAMQDTVHTVGAWIKGAQTTSSPFISSLNDGDVLLYNGTGILSDAIKFFTNSDVSHAALYLGAGENQMVGEAVDAGLIRDSRDKSFPGHNWVVVHRLSKSGDMMPVLKRADFYLDQNLKYAYQQLVLLGILLLTKPTLPSGILGKMIQQVCITAAEALNKFMESGKQLMICSEFVYRCYDEAVAGTNPYHLQIPGVVQESAEAVELPNGIAANSVLAKLIANPSLVTSSFQGARESMLAPALPLDIDVLQGQTELTIAEYLAEQRYGRPKLTKQLESTTSDEQVVEAICRFAIALSAARQYSAKPSSAKEALTVASQEALSADELPQALKNLIQTPADFVTPADLRKSPSLVEVGRVY